MTRSQICQSSEVIQPKIKKSTEIIMVEKNNSSPNQSQVVNLFHGWKIKWNPIAE